MKSSRIAAWAVGVKRLDVLLRKRNGFATAEILVHDLRVLLAFVAAIQKMHPEQECDSCDCGCHRCANLADALRDLDEEIKETDR